MPGPPALGAAGPDPEERYDFLFKLVLIGDASVGKTCLVQRFKTGAFAERQGSTIGVDFTMKSLELQGKRVKLQIWDTAGQERFRTITQSYYRSANGAILAYDISKKSSFQAIPRWIEDVRKYAGSNIVQLLIGSNIQSSTHKQQFNAMAGSAQWPSLLVPYIPGQVSLWYVRQELEGSYHLGCRCYFRRPICMNRISCH
ncbi:ras-related protein Rab-43 isoform X2 [Pelodiscus sinensis]|uniref:ras-related protein Rab-43 isoform X2 n=1 Tax=Pelodiscus sinensis TaxID=13735 RepID=UPI003F6B2C08